MQQFDAIIIGVGQAGAPLAHELAGLGRKVAVIEKQHVGGSCINYGCTPTKTMAASAKAAWEAARTGELGIRTTGVQTDFGSVISRRDEIVKNWRDGIRDGLNDADSIELIDGAASFSGPREVTISLNAGDTRKIAAEQIFINAGTSPRIPEIEGIKEIDYLTAKSMMDLDELPEHLLIIGGAYIGCEFGQMYRRLGSKVTIFESNEQLVGREDEDAGEELLKILRSEDIEVVLNAGVEKISKSGEKITLKVNSGEKVEQFSGSHLLIGAGTEPNTGQLNPGKAGIETDRHGYIKVNDKLETSVKNIFALGDIKGGPEFTHISYDDYRIVSQNLLHNGNRTVKDRLVPYTMFTDPQLGRVGHNEKSAGKAGINYKVAKIPMSSVARGVETGDTRGFMKVLVDPENEKILGTTMLMAEGGEIMSLIQTAMMGNLSYKKLRDTAFAHPTYAESLNNLFSNLK